MFQTSAAQGTPPFSPRSKSIILPKIISRETTVTWKTICPAVRCPAALVFPGLGLKGLKGFGVKGLRG